MEKSILIAPSLLSADFSDLKGQIALAEVGGADWLHLDIMDGNFVPNITIGPPVIRAIRHVTTLPFDTHLMISNPDLFLESFRDAGADQITVHYEACHHLHRTVQRIKQLGAKAGVSLNPATPVSVLKDILPDVDLILVMSVNPGFGGQSFIPQSIGRLRQLGELAAQKNPSVHIEVDGGIDDETAGAVVEAGANILVAGKFIYGSADVPGAIRTLRHVANQASQRARTERRM
jgi:ribulose-phosphate 3-epimerase